jgi:uncharacterized membrane protein
MEKFPIPAPAFSGDSRRVDAGAGFEWLRQGWAVFMAQPGQWILLSLLLLIVMLGISVVPLIGTLAGNLLTPVFLAGMLHASRRSAAGEVPEVSDLFMGFKVQTGNLVIVGLINMLGLFGIFLVTFALGGGGVLGGLMAGNVIGAGVAFGSIALAMFLSVVLTVPLIMAMWFAPALVFFNQMSPVDAVKASFGACARNALPFLVYGLIVLILAFFAALPVCLGFLVLLPVIAGSIQASYRDIFLAD